MRVFQPKRGKSFTFCILTNCPEEKAYNENAPSQQIVSLGFFSAAFKTAAIIPTASVLKLSICNVIEAFLKNEHSEALQRY